MIIDIHTHINNYEEDKVITPKQRLNKLLETMHNNKVDYSLILTSYKVNQHRASTRQAVELTKDLDNIGVVAGISYNNYNHKDIRELGDYLEAGLIKGFKFYPGYEPFYPYDIRLRLLYEMASEYGVPVMFHSGDTYAPRGKVKYSHPIHLDDVAVDFPDMKIVICHVGNPWIQDCMEVVYKNKNVYADFSGLTLGKFSKRFEKVMLNEIEHMIIYAGKPKYLLYGTDWPISNMKSYLHFVDELNISKESKEMILWKNGAELFDIDVNNLKSKVQSKA